MHCGRNNLKFGYLKCVEIPIFKIRRHSQMSIQNKLKEFMNSKIDVQKKAGADFLQTNKEKPGVITLPDGLQYEVIKEGSGAKPAVSAIR